MLRRRLKLTFVLLAMTLATVGSPHPTAADQTRIYWGAYIAGGPPWTARRIEAFEARASARVSIVHWGQPWSSSIAGGDREFPWAALQTVRAHGSIPLLDWGSWDLGAGLDQPAFTLASIARGDHDPYIALWAHTAGAWQHPFFLRFDPEMNGTWLPWSEQVNNNEPGEFVAAWRHVVDVFRQQGATNVSWVWCPNVDIPSTTPLSELYPGDDYVDWTCMDGYNYGEIGTNRWLTFGEIFNGGPRNGWNNTYQELLDLAPTKPIMIGEVATSRKGGNAAAWITDALTQELPTNFPAVKAVVWFDWDAGDSQLDWPIDTSPDMQQAFSSAINSGDFVGNEFSNLDVSPIPSPEDVWPATAHGD